MKTLIKIILNTFIGLAVIFLIGGFLMNYFAGLAGTITKGETFCVNKQYSIGKMLGGDDFTYFCDNKKKGKCISGLKSYKLGANNDLYLSFDIDSFGGLPEIKVNEMLKVDNPKGYGYRIFSNDYESEYYYAKTYSEIYRYLKLDYNTCKINFYSNNDLSYLSETDKNLFLELNK